MRRWVILFQISLLAGLGALAVARAFEATRHAYAIAEFLTGTRATESESRQFVGRELDSVEVVDTNTGERRVWDPSGEDVLLFYFDPSCAPCAMAMPSWIELISESDRFPSVTFASISLNRQRENVDGLRMSHETPREYWMPFSASVDVLVPISDEDLLGTGMFNQTPTTLLLEHGVVTALYLGPLGASEERWLGRRLRAIEERANGERKGNEDNPRDVQ